MRIGLERLLESPRRYLQRGRVGLCANATTVDKSFAHAVDLLHAHPEVQLTLLFGPEHGLRGDAQDMVSVTDGKDSLTSLPEVSLYGTSEESLSPKPEHLEQIDVLVFDVQDVGSRYYTYQATMALCMRAAAKAKIEMVVLDRPNPIGGTQVEGGGIKSGLENFCGIYPVPQRHGMTVGELARLYNTAFGIGCKLTVVPCEGWQRRQYFDATDAPWVLPSPNMPTLDTAIVYPGMCLIEGTALSEARGTTKPFELVGAPFVDGYVLARELEKLDLPGVIFRPCVFRPTFHKLAQQACGGVQLHVVDRQTFLPYRTGLAVIWAVKHLWPEQFAWRAEPYEFRTDAPAIDLLTGYPEVREAIDSGLPFDQVMQLAEQPATVFWQGRKEALLYA